MKFIKANFPLFQTALLVIILMGITTLLFLYTAGFRLNRDAGKPEIDLGKTGMISAKSQPEGANVYVDGTLRTATNDTIQGIDPGTYKLEIKKKGYVDWTKDIEVFAELVTDITAVLISQTPRLEPLTNTGAVAPSVSPTGNKLAFFSKDPENPGIWVIPIESNALNLFRTNPYVVIEDTIALKYSDGKEILWSPDEKFLLVTTISNIKYLINLETRNALVSKDSDQVVASWEQDVVEKRTELVSRFDIPQEIKNISTSNKTVWAPDDKKILYTTQNNDVLEYRVYNMEKPLPIGEKVENVVFTTKASDPQPKITWYSDSFHLILTEGDVMSAKTGKISIIRIDGTNKTEIFNNVLYSDSVFTAPSGDKIIILTTFKSGDTPNLYTIGIK